MNEALNESKNNIVYLPIDLLHPNKCNPRGDVGDVSELSDSIKAKGVLQNLTVVPREEGGYTIIIGHRRMAAAKLAGLTELPCIVTEMSESDQMGTMLLENMQRSDLTVYEQAQGMQMMLNLGISVSTISEKTGFSKATVRRRIKMARLNQKTLKSISNRQLSLTDFDRLYEIKDPDERNQVLSLMGTHNFENALKKAIDEQKRKNRVKAIRSVLTSHGITELQEDERTQFCSMAKYMRDPGDISVIDSLPEDTGKYRFSICYDTAYFYQKRGETEESRERDRIEIERRKRVAALDSASQRAFSLRKGFIAGFNKSEAKKHVQDAVLFAIRRWWTPSLYGQYDQKLYAELIGADVDGKAMSPELVTNETSAQPEYALLCFAYSMWCDSDNADYSDYYGRYEDNKKLNSIYDFLTSLGYEMSDEELELQSGTSALFYKEESESEDNASNGEAEAEPIDNSDAEEATVDVAVIAVDAPVSQLNAEYSGIDYELYAE